jgi:hypothetical protein
MLLAFIDLSSPRHSEGVSVVRYSSCVPSELESEISWGDHDVKIIVPPANMFAQSTHSISFNVHFFFFQFNKGCLQTGQRQQKHQR